MTTFEEAARIAGCRAIVQAEIDPPRAYRRFGASAVGRVVRPAHAAQARLPSMRGRRPSLRRRDDAHDASRRRAVDSGAARVRSVRLGRRAAAARRGAEDVAPDSMECEEAGVTHQRSDRQPEDEAGGDGDERADANDNGPETAADLIERFQGSKGSNSSKGFVLSEFQSFQNFWNRCRTILEPWNWNLGTLIAGLICRGRRGIAWSPGVDTVSRWSLSFSRV